MGAVLMVETLEGLDAGTLAPIRQDNSLATHAPILTRDDGRMDFALPAMTVYNRWRGFQPWPGAWTMLDGKKLSAHRLMPLDAGAVSGASAEPGTLHLGQARLLVACGENTWLELVEVQLDGKKRMPAADFLRGHTLTSGDRLGQ
jgi:methionyl-tRNA formyltransferase